MTIIGLLFIVAAWVLQYVAVSKKNYKLQPSFVSLYAIGVLALVVQGFMQEQYLTSFLNAIALGGAILTLIHLGRKGKK